MIFFESWDTVNGFMVYLGERVGLRHKWLKLNLVLASLDYSQTLFVLIFLFAILRRWGIYRLAKDSLGLLSFKVKFVNLVLLVILIILRFLVPHLGFRSARFSSFMVALQCVTFFIAVTLEFLICFIRLWFYLVLLVF